MGKVTTKKRQVSSSGSSSINLQCYKRGLLLNLEKIFHFVKTKPWWLFSFRANDVTRGKTTLFFFFYQVFFHRQWRFTGLQGKGGNHLYSSLPLLLTQEFICNFACEMTTPYFLSHLLRKLVLRRTFGSICHINLLLKIQ